MSKKSKKKNNLATISTCIIVKNEKDNLPLLIDDLKKFSEEIIIVDTGSTDGTLEWLKENQNDVLKLYEFEWIDDFSAARNFSFSKATKDWIFWCDADDRISEKLSDKIIVLKNSMNNDIYNVYGTMYKYTPTFTHYRNRLLKRSDNPRWECVCHECVTCDDMKIVQLADDCVIIHQHDHGNSSRNAEIFEKHINAGRQLTRREIFCYAHEINALGRDFEAQQIVLNNIFGQDAWDVLVWEGMMDVMRPLWTSSIEQANIGIAIIDRYENLNRLRGDVCYLKAVLYDIVQDFDNCFKYCNKALEIVMKTPDDYNEDIHFSKICPAMTLYNNTEDESVKIRMKYIVEQYRGESEFATQWLDSL